MILPMDSGEANYRKKRGEGLGEWVVCSSLDWFYGQCPIPDEASPKFTGPLRLFQGISRTRTTQNENEGRYYLFAVLRYPISFRWEVDLR